MVAAIVRGEPSTLQPPMSGFTKYPYLRRVNANPAAYINVLSKLY